MPPFTVLKSPATTLCFTEPLENLGDAIPLDMVLVKGGSFLMGSPKDEPNREPSEGPQHLVTVPEFFMGRHPVTQAQYESLMGDNPATAYEADRFVAPNKPVVGVSWWDAVAFCTQLAKSSGRAYRLPSEAEWEYACRAGTKTPFAFGQTLTTAVANYNGKKTYNGGPAGEYRNATTAVNGLGVANAWGLGDMHGNVWEWCQDHWHDSYDGAPEDGGAWLSNDEKASRVLRGGSWGNDPRSCRSASRDNYPPGLRTDLIGFRVVCRAPRTP